MNEAERAKAVESLQVELQLELFSLKRQLEKQAEQLKLVFKQKLELVKSQGTKVCRICHEERSVAKQFYRDDRYKDGYNPYCRICRSRRYYAKKARNAA